jgi:SAM-dependent methyltransferase
MAAQWFATHAAGFGPLALRLAERDCPGSRPRAEGGNALRLECAEEPRALAAYCRSLFRVVGEAGGGLERGARAIAADPGSAAALGLAAGRAGPRGSFVLRAFGPEDPAPLSRPAREALERLIARATGLEATSPQRAGPAGREREYRLQERADGTALLLERLGAREGEPRRGELPATTCRLLAEMTEPEEGDVFLDPFCGYGGIALERSLAAPYRFVFASDIDPEKVQALKASLSGKSFERRRRTIFPKLRDALDPTAFESGFVTAIATDPPWGIYAAGPGGEESSALLGAFLDEAARLLAPGGRLVLLLARELEIEALAGFPPGAFVRRESLEVLVSGRKARALRLDRA